MKYEGEFRNDSPGHRAKYCTYAMMNNSKKKEKKKEHNYWESLFSESHKRDTRHSLSELSRSGKKNSRTNLSFSEQFISFYTANFNASQIVVFLIKLKFVLILITYLKETDFQS